MKSWFDQYLDVLASGRSGYVGLETLSRFGAYSVFHRKQGVFVLQYRRGYADPGFQYSFLLDRPEILEPVFQLGSAILQGNFVSEPERIMLGAIDRLEDPQHLILVELPETVSVSHETIRLAFILSLSKDEKKMSEAGSGESLSIPGRELPVWLNREMEGLLKEDRSVLILSESGSGAEELLEAVVRTRFGSLDRCVFFFPQRLAEPVQLREFFGDAAGARLGGSISGIPLVDRDGGAIAVMETAELSFSVQNRLAGCLEQDLSQTWYFLSNQDLAGLERARKFHTDLYRLLERQVLILPPLRARKEQLREETERLLRLYRDRYRRDLHLSEGAHQTLQDYDWPGNWRELKKTIEFAFLMNRTGVIEARDIQAGRFTGPESHPNDLNLRNRTEQLEKELLLKAYAIHGGNQVHMARALGISRGSLQYKMEKFGMIDD